jgi:hypothetical protein
MGMDVMGRNATSETGTYFRRNVWGWRPLWSYVEDMHADIASKVEYAQSNDGDGLDADDAYALGLKLYNDIADGITARYVAERDAAIAAMPDKPCEYCGATGVRTDSVGVEMGMDKKKWCNACDGKGSVRPWEASYGLDVDDVREFADFLVDCGGFNIY